MAESFLSEEAVFLLSFIAMGIVAFSVFTVIELIFLKRSGWVGSGNTVVYAGLAGLFGFLIYTAFFGLLVVLFLVFFSATLGGAVLISLGSILVFLVALAVAPLLMIGCRAIARKLSGIDKSELTWKYSTAMSFSSIFFLVLVVAIVIGALSVLERVTG